MSDLAKLFEMIQRNKGLGIIAGSSLDPRAQSPLENSSELRRLWPQLASAAGIARALVADGVAPSGEPLGGPSPVGAGGLLEAPNLLAEPVARALVADGVAPSGEPLGGPSPVGAGGLLEAPNLLAEPVARALVADGVAPSGEPLGGSSPVGAGGLLEVFALLADPVAPAPDAARNVFAGAEANASRVGGDVEPAPDDASEALRKALTSQMTEEVQPEKLGLGRRLALALANAGSAYAAGINSNVRQQDFIEPLRALRERRAQRETGRRQAAARTGLDSLNREEAIRTRASERGEDRAFAEEQAGLNRQARAEQDRLNREAQATNLETQLEAQENRLTQQNDARIKELELSFDKRLEVISAEQGAAAAQKLEDVADKEDRNLAALRNEFLLGDERSGTPPLIDLLIEQGATHEQIMTIVRERAEVFGGRPATVERILQRIDSVLREKIPDETLPGRGSFGVDDLQGGGGLQKLLGAALDKEPEEINLNALGAFLGRGARRTP